VLGSKKIGPTIQDENVFEDEVVPCEGALIGLVVATSYPIAKKAAKLVQIEYEELVPILTIEDAIRSKLPSPPLLSFSFSS